MFDDAFEKPNENQRVVNQFVQQFCHVINKATIHVYHSNNSLKKLKVFVTPYGGRLEWTLRSGKNKLIVHLKDKDLIRHRKRWSQV